MKSKIKYLLIGILSFACVTINVKAEDTNIVETKDIEPRTYIIGTHMFTYEGTDELTLSKIMLASKTIKGSNIEDMVIYYKSPLHGWIDSVSGEKITNMPETFEIDYKDEKKNYVLKYGDVDVNGQINMLDVTHINRYIAGNEIPENIQIENGDVNGDGRITEADSVLLSRVIIGDYYPEANLPKEPLGKTYVIEYLIDYTSYYKTHKIDYQLEGYTAVKPETPIKEGYIFDGWYTDINYVNKFELETTKIQSNITLYAKFKKIKYGDVNLDDQINMVDLTYINKYVAGYEISDEIQIENGDVNGDGRITEADSILLSRVIVGDYYPEANLPEEPLGKTYIIEYTIDCTNYFETYKIDYELEGHTLTKPETPTKEGYIFEGWYTDINYKNEFKFRETEIKSNLILYAKFVKPQYGDVDLNGEINMEDVTYINKYLAGYELTDDIEIKNGDVNGDGRVTEADPILLTKYISNYYPEANLPEEPLGTTYIIEYTIDCTSYFETYKKDYELEGQTVTKPEDPIKDGYTFEGWYTDINYKNEFEFGKTEITSNLVLFAKFVKLQ